MHQRQTSILRWIRTVIVGWRGDVEGTVHLDGCRETNGRRVEGSHEWQRLLDSRQQMSEANVPCT